MKETSWYGVFCFCGWVSFDPATLRKHGSKEEADKLAAVMGERYKFIEYVVKPWMPPL